MPRRLLALLALLLLALAADAVAEEGKDESGHGGDDDPRHGEKDDDKGDEGDDKDKGDDDKNDDRDGDKGRRGGGDDERRRERDDRKDDDRRDRKARKAPVQGLEAPAPPIRIARPTVVDGPEPKPSGDASLTVVASALPGKVRYAFAVSAIGLDGAPALAATLPDLGGAWTLAGADADACSVTPEDGSSALACTFEGLGVGDVAFVQASAAFTTPPAWAPTMTAHLSAPGDAVPGNNAASDMRGLLLIGA